MNTQASFHATGGLILRTRFLLMLLVLMTGALLVNAALETPRLLSPVNGMEMTDVASYFQWMPVNGCTNFQIQIARDAEFKDIVKEKRTTNKGFHKNLYFPKEILLAGSYCWRVRALKDGQEGPWSVVNTVKVNDSHNVASDLVRTITPEAPLFLMRSRVWDPIKQAGNVAKIIPAGLERVIVVDDIALASEKVFDRAKKYQELGLDFVIWNNRCQVSLATMEYLFQNFSHCLGTAEGEHFSGLTWEKGPEGNLAESDFIHRAWILCGKYGRFYFFADGDGGSYRWQGFAQREKETFARYGRNIVPMFKTTNADLALHSYGQVQGLMASGYARNCGIWADEWVWPECGFGKLGETIPKEKLWENRRKVGTRQCPWVYDIQIWLMGIVSGSTVFQLESAHQWKPDGSGAAHYDRVFLPFVKAVVEHRLIPSRQAFLENIKLAVTSDMELAKGKHEKQYTGGFAFLKELYALQGPGDQELIPNNSRYGIICLLPPETTALKPPTRVLNQKELVDTTKAVAMFNAAYPQRFTGDAFMWECDGTVIVTNSRENEDVSQKFQLQLERGPVRGLAGSIGVHQYLIGKIAADGNSFWFQANAESPERCTELSIACPRKPDWKIVPASAAKEAAWDEATKTLKLRLSHKDGAVEVTL